MVCPVDRFLVCCELCWANTIAVESSSAVHWDSAADLKLPRLELFVLHVELVSIVRCFGAIWASVAYSSCIGPVIVVAVFIPDIRHGAQVQVSQYSRLSLDAW